MTSPCRFLLLALLALFFGCKSGIDVPDLGQLYNRLAQYHGRERNPVIVIPGILGSRLVSESTGDVVWGAFSGDFASPSDPEGIRAVALPMATGQSLRELVDDNYVDGALDEIKLKVFGIPLTVRAYAQILGTLGIGGYRDQQLGEAGAIDYGDDHYTCFQFAYDWRRDVVENAARLHEYIIDRRAYVMEEMERREGKAPEDVRFDIVAHSMGGVVARYYLRHGAADLPADGSIPFPTWAGARYVERLIMVATPNAGSLHAVDQLNHGYQAAPLLPHYGPEILGTYPSIYEMLPRTRHRPVSVAGPDQENVDVLNPLNWEKYGWGLASPDIGEELQILLPGVESAEERRQIALEHLHKCLGRARSLQAFLDQNAAPPGGTDLFLFAGDTVDTPLDGTVDPDDGTFEFDHYAPGDGTVLRSSTLLDERVGGEWQPRLVTPIQWKQVTFLFEDHLGLTKDPAFANNVLYLLLEDPR